jgi:two-component system, LytTR family, response regulator
VRALIVDDEPAARRRLAIMLEELDVEVAGEAANGVEALAMARTLSPDVILLDIQMREVSGLDVARNLSEPKPLVIFQTAHDQYAVRAFEEHAVDYLLKPVSLDRLRASLERAQARLAAGAGSTLDSALAARLDETLRLASRSPRPRFLARDGSGHRLLAFREVLRFTTVDGAVTALAASGRFGVDLTLDELERRSGGGYVRVSRGDLVNIEAIRRIDPAEDGAATLTLADGTQVRVSRRRAADVKQVLAGNP